MKNRLWYIASTTFFSLLAILFVGVFITSLGKNAIDMFVRVGWDWRHTGNYVGLIVGFAAYILFLIILTILKSRHNLYWFMKFTHELTHTLVALLFFRRIEEFVVSRRDCHVHYQRSRFGYVPITLSPYCIPIYTFMLFPFRFVGDAGYMIVFDALIAFSYAFHIHMFIRQTRLSQPDIENCGTGRSAAFIMFVHFTVLALILAIPKGGVLNAVQRVFWKYPAQILGNPVEWFQEIIKYF